MTMTNIRKKSLFLIFLIATIAFVVIATIPILKKVNYREYKPVSLSKELKEEIKINTNNLTTYDIIIYSKDKTRELLTFSTKCEKFDDRRITKAHCVGYAQVYSTICNYAFEVNNIKGSARPVVGIVKWNGINLNFFSKYLPTKWRNFTKDHDFVEVKYENRIIYVDPTLNVINF